MTSAFSVAMAAAVQYAFAVAFEDITIFLDVQENDNVVVNANMLLVLL